MLITKENENPKRSENSEKIDDDGSKNGFAQKCKDSLICHCCGEKGHAAPDCILREKIPR
jgi:hypothetical protein